MRAHRRHISSSHPGMDDYKSLDHHKICIRITKNMLFSIPSNAGEGGRHANSRILIRKPLHKQCVRREETNLVVFIRGGGHSGFKLMICQIRPFCHSPTLKKHNFFFFCYNKNKTCS